jgi:hypothetical protein
MSQCARPCCNKPAKNKCSSCLKEWYCSGECQKSDWKKHKSFCRIVEDLSNDLQPYHQVHQVIIKILNASENMRVLNHLLCYAELQFGGRDPEIAYRQRTNGEKIDNFQVEICCLIPIYEKLIDATLDDTSLNETDRETTLVL